jgi:hypothetical protein
MKKSILSILGLAMIVASCGESSSEDPIIPGVVDGLQGTISEDVILDGEYALTGAYIVPAGKTLTIKAGTKIVAEAGGTEVYIGVNKGAIINIEGTATNPVIISSINGEQSDWGGLVICGKGITSAGVDVTFEVGGFQYGGTEADDSSGSIRYLVISGSGAQINADAQYNGISFCAVGSGTTVEYVAVINGGDDGVEFYGGSVEASNLYLKNNLDDSIDWTEAWDGSVSNAYISHSVQGFSTVFEGDKDNANPSFTNITAISSTGGTALQFKIESGATISNLFLEGYDLEIDFKDDGAHSNVQIDGSDAVLVDDSASQGKLVYTKGTKLDISGWGWIDAVL